MELSLDGKRHLMKRLKEEERSARHVFHEEQNRRKDVMDKIQKAIRQREALEMLSTIDMRRNAQAI